MNIKLHTFLTFARPLFKIEERKRLEQIKSPIFKRSNIGEGIVGMLQIYSNHSNIIHQSGLDILQIKHLGKFFQRKRGWHNLINESFVQSNVETKYYVNHTKFSNMHHGVGMVL